MGGRVSLESLQKLIMQYVNLNNPNFFLSWFCFLICVIFVFNLFTRRRKLNVPPSPPKLPFIGNLHQMGTLPHHTFRALSHKYGPLMLLHLGQTPTLVVSSVEIAREIYKSHDIVFSNRTQTTAAEIFFYGCKDIGFVPYGEEWRQKRKICVLELLSLKRVQSFQFIREEEVAEMVTKIRETCLKNFGCSVNMTEMLFRASNNIVLRCIFGQKYDTSDGGISFGDVARKVMNQLPAFSFGDFFPSLGWMDVVIGLTSKLKATGRELDSFFNKVIAQHKTAERNDDAKEQSNENKDFVDNLLRRQEDGMLGIELTNDDIKAILMEMFLAGSETSSTTVEWAMAELVRNPITMKKAQEEVQRVVGNKSKVDENDIKQMKYLECVVKEVLRLHPAAPLVHRRTSSSVKLRGYDIPPKTSVCINVWAIQKDPQVWERAEEFVPERFENSEVDFKGQYFQFMPFGSGRRACPGMSFGVVTVEYVLANLLYWFDWKLPQCAEDIDMSETYGTTASKKLPLYLQPLPQFGSKI